MTTVAEGFRQGATDDFPGARPEEFAGQLGRVDTHQALAVASRLFEVIQPVGFAVRPRSDSAPARSPRSSSQSAWINTGTGSKGAEDCCKRNLFLVLSVPIPVSVPEPVSVPLPESIPFSWSVSRT
jgi:hypothetical protein